MDLSSSGIKTLIRHLEPSFGHRDGHQYDLVTFLQDDPCHYNHSWVLLQELIDYPWSASKDSETTASVVASKTIPVLLKYGSPESVRVVFWFDG